jgi:oligoribonuclease NrnB/cAMP/cGMP phosphodiesterase (DHH superfamily)
MCKYTLEQLKKVQKVIVHQDCSDGTASAIVLHSALPQAIIQFVQYGTKNHKELKAEPGLLFCDMSPPPERAEEFKGSLILDHHKYAKELVESLGGIYANEDTEPGVSGAVLAYREVWLPIKSRIAGNEHSLYIQEQLLRLSKLAGIYDTWQTSSPDWERARYLAEALKLYSWYSWSGLEEEYDPEFDKDLLEERLAVGELLVNRSDEFAQRAADEAYKCTLSTGHTLAIVQGTYIVNKASEFTGCDMTIAFHFYIEDGQPNIRFSCRSRGTFDVGLLAKHYKGGGHVHAAGFRMYTTKEPFSYTVQLVEDYLGQISKS